MIRNCLAALVSIVSIVPAAAAQDATAVIAAASQAVGADRLNTVEYSGSGYDFAIGQAYNPSSPWPKFIDKTYTRAIDFSVPASRMDRVRLQGENPPHGGGQQPVRGEQTQNQTVIVNANTPWAQQLEIWMLPHAFLKAAAQHHASVKAQTIGGKRYNVVTFMGLNKASVNGYIGADNLIDRVETTIDNTVLGDIRFEALYSDYKDFGGIKFPTHIVQKQGGYPVLGRTISEVKPNAAVSIQPPQGRGGAPAGTAPAAAPSAAIPTEKL